MLLRNIRLQLQRFKVCHAETYFYVDAGLFSVQRLFEGAVSVCDSISLLLRGFKMTTEIRDGLKWILSPPLYTS